MKITKTAGKPMILVRVPRIRGRHRPKGSKDSIPKNVRASVRAVIEEVVTERSPTIKHAIVEGLQSGPRNADRYLRLCAEYTDGKPNQTLDVRTQFKEDEMDIASRSLTKKMESLFATAKRVHLLPVEDARAVSKNVIEA